MNNTLQQTLRALEKLSSDESVTTRIRIVANICVKKIASGGIIIIACDNESEFLGLYFTSRLDEGHIYRDMSTNRINKNDVVIAITTDPNSKIVVAAISQSYIKGAYTIAMLNDDNGKLTSSCQFQWRVPAQNKESALMCMYTLLRMLLEEINHKKDR